jgi:hypothetical protein
MPSVRRLFEIVAVVCIGAGLGVSARAAEPALATSAGPGRIICKATSFCELGIGVPAHLRYRVDGSALPDADKARLKQCTVSAKPCVVTVNGTEMGDAMKVKAAKITWYN